MSRRLSPCSLVFKLGCLFGVQAASAHEFWIDPLEYEISEDQKLLANNRVGQMMNGDVNPYISSTFVEFSLTDSDGKRMVEGNLGDRPTLQRMTPRSSGLHVIGLQSTPSGTRYKTAEKFEGFLRKEGIAWVLEAHRARDLPEDGFKEAFTRFAKSLVAVGDGAGADGALGFRFELIAETNPYTEDGPVTVRLEFEGEPMADAQVSIFRRDAGDAVTRETVQTDAEGRATIPSEAGSTYLLNAVHMVEPAAALAERKNVVWHSLWASLTYRIK